MYCRGCAFEVSLHFVIAEPCSADRLRGAKASVLYRAMPSDVCVINNAFSLSGVGE